ncbi:MAG TPA: LPS assembly protein LptD [Rhodanobacteraceae bacterium]|nr:LPS assembly protein LptD [Rhodanobacteraceae bacterium]
MLRRSTTLTPRTLAFAIAMAVLPATAAVAQSEKIVCPLGAFTCPRDKNDFSLCKKNDLLDFYVSGLPTTGDASQAVSDVRADRLESPDSNVFHLYGDVRLQRLDQLLRAEHVDYTEDSTAYLAQGNVRYQDRNELFSATRMRGTTDPEYGVADDVRYQLLSSRGNGSATQATILDAQHSAYKQVSYSTCDPSDRVWELRSNTMAIDQDSGVGRAHDVTLRLKGVPFLWLPYMRFPVDKRRQSGFLYPSFGSSSHSGLYFALPYYFNLAPNYDATLTPRIYSDRGVMLGGEFRYLMGGSSGILQFNYMPQDRVANRDRGFLHFQDSTYLMPGWVFNASVNRVTDKSYFQDFGNNLTAAVTSLIGSSAYLSGSGDWWDAGLGVDTWQITDPTIPDSAEPFRRLPRLYFNADRPFGPLGGPEWGINAEAVRFQSSFRPGGERADIYPYLAWPLQGAAWFVRPELGYRYTAYNLERPAISGGSTDPSRSVPIFDVDAGLIFERDTNLFGNSYTQTLEPRLYYLRVPYRNQDDLPLFDTQPLTFDFWQLFTTNSFSGADRQENANNLSLALTTRLLDDNGVEKLSASIGQIRYFDPQRVTLRPGQKISDFSGSNYVGNLELALSDNWRLTASQQWNPNTDETDVSTVGIERRIRQDGVLNLAYRYRRGLIEQVDASSELPISDHWKLVGRYDYSLRDKKVVDAFAGVEWDGCCTAARVLVRRYVRDFKGDVNNAIFFEVEFKGLGEYGQKTESFLQHSILGYQ